MEYYRAYQKHTIVPGPHKLLFNKKSKHLSALIDEGFQVIEEDGKWMLISK